MQESLKHPAHFAHAVYDTLGEAGLAARTAVGHRYSSPEEVGIDAAAITRLSSSDSFVQSLNVWWPR